MVKKIDLKKIDYRVKLDGLGLKYEHSFKNKKGEKILVWIYSTKHFKSGLMEEWVKKGYLKSFIEETWHIETYVTDKEGICRGSYNPCVIPNTHQLNFKYILPANERNLNKILKKCHEMSEK